MATGRRTKLTPKLAKTLAKHVAAGNTFRVACQLSDLPERTFFFWMKVGRDAAQKIIDDKPGEASHLTPAQLRSWHLLQAIQKADAEAEARNVGLIQVAGANTWQAAAWWLERRHPQNYSLNETLRAKVEEEADERWINATRLMSIMEGTMRGIDPGEGVLPQTWTTYHHTGPQMELLTCDKRFTGVYAGRGSGKTDIYRRRLVIALGERKKHPDARYFYAAPTNLQAMRIGWDSIRALIPDEWFLRESKSEQYFETIFGSRVYILGLDVPQRIEGLQWDGGVIDESCDQRPGVFDLNILPALTHRTAWCARIGVPKRYGIGAREFRKWCEDAEQGDDPDSFATNWPSSDVLPPAELEYARRTLDPRDYREQFQATWETAGGTVFWTFDNRLNVRPCRYEPSAPLIIGCDFNRDPMCWVIGHRYADRLEFFDELFVRNTNTRSTLDMLWDRYQHHQGPFEFYADASGSQRRTSAQMTAAGEIVSDLYEILNDENFKGSNGGRILAFPRATPGGRFEGNPARSMRFRECNALLLNSNGDRRCHFSPSCIRLIDDLEHRHYPPGSNEPDDDGDLGHMTDAWGYIVHRLFPIRLALAVEGASVIIKRGTT